MRATSLRDLRFNWRMSLLLFVIEGKPLPGGMKVPHSNTRPFAASPHYKQIVISTLNGTAPDLQVQRLCRFEAVAASFSQKGQCDRSSSVQAVLKKKEA